MIRTIVLVFFATLITAFLLVFAQETQPKSVANNQVNVYGASNSSP